VAEIKNFLTENKLFAIVGSACFILFSVLLYTGAPREGHYEVDSVAYERVAHEFVRTGAVQEPDGTCPIHTQGYHFFLGMLYVFLGNDLWIVLAVQVLLALLSIFSLAQTALLLCGHLCARIVFVLALMDGAFFVYPQFILADTLLLFLVTLFFERCARFYRTKKRSYLMQAGFILGLSVIVKPTALFFPLGLAVCFFVLSRFVPLSVGWADYAYFCAAFYAPVFLYILRNGLMFGQYKLSFLMEGGLYHWFHAVILAQLQGQSVLKVLSELGTQGDTRYSTFQPEYWVPLKAAFSTTCFAHPFIVIKMYLQNISKTFFGLYSVQLQLLFDSNMRGNIIPFHEIEGGLLGQLYSYFTWAFRNPFVGSLMLFEAGMNGFKWVLGGWAVKEWYHKGSYELLTFFLCVIGCFSAVTGFYGAGRYRILFEPLLLILAAQGILSLYKMYKNIRLSSPRLHKN
jgi:hypothetical protein